METKLKKLQTILDVAKLEYDAIDLADALWLSQHISGSDRSFTEENTNQKKEERKSTKKEENKTPLPVDTKPQSKVKKIIIQTEITGEASVHVSTKNSKKSGLPINIKQIPYKTNQTTLYNALKRFRQKKVSTSNYTLDIDKIVDVKADTKLFIPYYKPDYENRFELIIVIDSGDTMQLWDEEIDKFTSSIKSFNLFKDIREVYLDSSKKEPKFHKTKTMRDQNFGMSHYLKSDTLVMIISDMTSKAWRSGEISKKIFYWQNRATFFILQMFPSHLWNRTILKDAELVRFYSNRKPKFNHSLKSDVDDMLEFLDSSFKDNKSLLKLPIATMDLNSLEALSKVITGKVNSTINGAIIYIDDIKPQDKEELTDGEKVSKFYENSSKISHQLLHYLSVVPLDINVMKIVQKLMMQESTKVNLAEILTSGLLKKEDELYQFSHKKKSKDGVREILKNQLGTSKYIQTIQTLSNYVENNIDTGFSSLFQAILKDSDTKEIGILNRLDTEFARINIDRLMRLGGKFEKLAKRLIVEIKAIIPKSKRFKMGSDSGNNDEKPIHEVIINYDFEIAKYPVTFEEYDLFCEDTKKEKPDDESWGRGKRPVINVSWNDAKEYCKWISEKTGEKYRLPTEAEWEYSCRAGTTTKWSFGDDEKELKNYAWYDKNAYDKGKKHPDYGTHPVGEKKPNPWELYDIHGNVWEWCEDNFVDNYKETPRDGKAHIDEKADYKVLRGGSWYVDAIRSHSAVRDRDYPTDRYSIGGFRLLRTLNDKDYIYNIVSDDKNIKEKKWNQKNFLDEYSNDIILLVKSTKTDDLENRVFQDDSFPSDDNSATIIAYDVPETVKIIDVEEIKTNVYNIKVEMKYNVNFDLHISKRDYYTNDKIRKLYSSKEELNDYLFTVEGKAFLETKGKVVISLDKNKELNTSFLVEITDIKLLEQIPAKHSTSSKFIHYDIYYDCEKCSTSHGLNCSDLEWDAVSSSERGMGAEVEHEAEYVDNCNECENEMSITFSCWEYPVKAENMRDVVSQGIKNLYGDCCPDFFRDEEYADQVDYDESITVDDIKEWFFKKYEDPANSLPYISKEGGYQWIHGESIDVEQALYDQFEGECEENMIKQAIDDINDEYGYMNWSPIPIDEDDFNDKLGEWAKKKANEDES